MRTDIKLQFKRMLTGQTTENNVARELNISVAKVRYLFMQHQKRKKLIVNIKKLVSIIDLDVLLDFIMGKNS
ncbi:MAG: hypothetical protein AB9835_12635 [Eubacteriales bacterium]